MDVPKFQKKLLFMPSKAAQDCSFVSEAESVMSPMTELAVNFEMSSMSTPRRKLSLSNSINPTPERSNSFTGSLESGIESGSPFQLEQCPDFESPTIENIRARKCSAGQNNSSSNLRRQLMTRRSFSSPVFPRKQLEPLNFDELSPSLKKSPKCKPGNVLKPINHLFENVEEKHSDLSLLEMADNFPDLDGNFEIKKRKYVGRSHSAPTISDDFNDIFDSGSSSHSTHSTWSNDDGFFDEMKDDINTNGISTSAPSNIIGLINYPIFDGEKKEEDKENQVPKVKREFANPNKLQIRSRSTSLSVKRDSPATHSPSPIKRNKRPRHGVYRSQSVYEMNQEEKYSAEKKFDLPTPTRSLQRSQSFDVRHSKSPDLSKFFDMDDKTLIGDKSKQYCLPICSSKHPDLKGITPDTLADLLDGKYKNVVDEYFIIDSRYPYEFEGGHIKHALNVYEKQDILDKFLKNPPTASLEKRQILIFHCEFSSKRGPGMSRFLRNKDRDAHQNDYPKLYYPELYLLEGGYKEFYEQKPKYCVPETYREMLDPNYQQQLKLFTKRSKSWSEDNRSLGSRIRRRPLLQKF